MLGPGRSRGNVGYPRQGQSAMDAKVFAAARLNAMARTFARAMTFVVERSWSGGAS